MCDELGVLVPPSVCDEAGQCRNVTMPGGFFSASNGSPVTIGLNTDGR